ncbi:sensor histidine kinase [Bradyrhizobium sp. Pha-3]|uniref:sensor histidine kinase n=1 Tax=Bradyrhizobium sp. Pha-3 TaxID=208375 RepID=UPI0035D4157B
MQIASAAGLEEACDHGPTRKSGAEPLAESLLLREMSHRIKNELMSTIGYVSTLAARSTNCGAKLALVEVIEHLYSHARVYEALQMPTESRLINATAYLRTLCRTISRAKLENNQIELVLIEHPLQLSSLQCWRLGMIVSELITNSYRHAFGDEGGTIRVELKRCGHLAECRVTDDGSSSDIVRSGHGLNIVRQLARTLDGEIDLRFGYDGAVALVTFPLPTQR